VRSTRSGNRDANITAVEVLDAQGRSVRALRACEPAQIVLDVRVERDLPELTAGILLRDALGNDVFGTNTFHHGQIIPAPTAGSEWRLHFDIASLALGRGSYSISAALHSRDTHITDNYDWWDQALVFQVVPGEHPLSIGVCDLPVQIRTVKTSSQARA